MPVAAPEEGDGILGKILMISVFKIDALGLVTMLGADEVNNYFGQLLTNRWVDWMPQLGGFVIAGGKFREPQPGFTMYNITDGITTHDISSWLSRWLISRDDFYHSLSMVEWKLVDPGRTRRKKAKELFYRFLPIFIGLVFNGGLLAFTVLQGDLWGIIDTVALICMIFVRQLMISQTRAALDRGPWKALSDAKKAQADAELRLRANPTSEAAQEAAAEATAIVTKYEAVKRIFCIMPNGNLISMTAPGVLVTHGMTRQPQLGREILTEKFIDAIKEKHEERGDRIDRLNRKFTTAALYSTASWIGWLSFGIHVIAIGQAGLIDQIITVVAIIVSTVVSTYKIGCDDKYIAKTVKAERGREQRREEECLFRFMRGKIGQPDRRVIAYSRWFKHGLVNGRPVAAAATATAVDRPDSSDIAKLKEWQLLPLSTNTGWHREYQRYVDLWDEYNAMTPEQRRLAYGAMEREERDSRLTRRREEEQRQQDEAAALPRRHTHLSSLHRRHTSESDDLEKNGGSANGTATANGNTNATTSPPPPNIHSAGEQTAAVPDATNGALGD